MQEKIRKAEAEQARVNATKAMAERNRERGRGGFQSDFAQDKGFMGGKGTAAEMGSFAKGGLARIKSNERSNRIYARFTSSGTKSCSCRK